MWYLDTYIGNPDGNLSCIFFGRKNIETGLGIKGRRRGTGAEKKGALHTLFTFGMLNT